MRTFIAFLLLVASVHAETITVTELAPPLPGGSTTSTYTAINPVTGDIWMSNGQKLFKLGLGEWVQEIGLLQSVGGPIGTNNATTALAFDSIGRMYVNDVNTGSIFRSSDGVIWTAFAAVDSPRAMAFDSDGDLIVIGGNSSPTVTGNAWRISPAGVVTDFGDTQGESFVFDGDDLIIPHYDGTGIDRLTQAGVLTTLFSWARPVPILYEAIAMTSLGNFVVSVNLGADDTGNRSQLIRVDGLTGARTTLTAVDAAIPVEMFFNGGGQLVMSSFGSLHAQGGQGDFDNASAVPEPSALALAGIGAVWLYGWRRKRHG